MKKTIFLFDCSEHSSALLPEEGVPRDLLSLFAGEVRKITSPFLRPKSQEEENRACENPFYVPCIIASNDANMFFFAHAAAYATSTHFYPYANNWSTTPKDEEFFTAQLYYWGCPLSSNGFYIEKFRQEKLYY